MPRFAIEKHPQKRKIIDAILCGVPVRDIAAWSEPPVSVSAIQRYKAAQVQPMMANAESLALILKKTNDKNEVVQGKEAVQQAIMGAPILAARDRRLEALQDRHDRLKLILDERAVEMKDEVAGGASGLLTRDYKGKDADRAIYKVDAALLSEFREHEKQVAQELGQWQENTSGTMIAIQIVCPAVPEVKAVVPVSSQTIDIAVSR